MCLLSDFIYVELIDHIQNVQLKRESYFNMSNLLTKIYML
jgi:hypothetical protein